MVVNLTSTGFRVIAARILSKRCTFVGYFDVNEGLNARTLRKGQKGRRPRVLEAARIKDR